MGSPAARWIYPPTIGSNNYLGILRFGPELSVTTIAHEAVHVGVTAARAYFGCDHLTLRSTGKGLREEVVAYVAAPLTEILMVELLGIEIPGVVYDRTEDSLSFAHITEGEHGG